MVRYSFGTRLTRLSDGERREGDDACITVMTLEEFREAKETYLHRKVLVHSMENIHYCKAEAYGGCTMGTFMIPNKNNLLGEKFSFGFYVTDSELILLDEGDMLTEIITRMEDIASKEGTVHAHAGAERAKEKGMPAAPAEFLILLMDYLIRNDVLFLQKYEAKLEDMEDELLDHQPKNFYETVIVSRKELLALHTYYWSPMTTTCFPKGNAPVSACSPAGPAAFTIMWRCCGSMYFRFGRCTSLRLPPIRIRS